MFSDISTKIGSAVRAVSIFRRHKAAGVLAAVIAILTMSACQKPEATTGEPEIIESLRQKGLTIIDTFTAKGGLRGWVGTARGEPIAFYLTPDGRYVIAGSVLDSNFQDVNQEAIEAKLKSGLVSNVWEKVEASTWVPDGQPDAQRIVYVFTDINCGFCNRLWADARPWVDGGKVQLRHIMVGIIRENSSAKAATVLMDENPSARLADYGNFVRSGRPATLQKNDIQPVDAIPAEIMTQIDANHQLMASLRLQATPSLVWKDEKGGVQVRMGAAEHTVLEAFGPI